MRMTRLSSFSRFLAGSIKSVSIRLSDPGREKFLCPICGYFGPFLQSGVDRVRHHVCCAVCGSRERHRLMWLVLKSLAKQHDFSQMRALHFAPEHCLRQRLASMFGKYETGDLSGKNVDHQVDMCDLPFPEQSFDVVIASHVLHHIRDEASALRNLRRILRPGGMAIVPVPVFANATVEYPEPIDTQMRATGRDYFDRCSGVFGSVRLYSSMDFEPRYQAWIYEDRSNWPAHLYLRPCSPGEKHPEFIPVCFR
jgi:SAM-dependent methyltransferase